MRWQRDRRASLRAAFLLVLALVVPSPGVADETSGDPLLESFEAELETQAVAYPDPLENLNRRTQRLNAGLNEAIFDPMTRLYSWMIPEPGRKAIRRFLSNLAAPSTLINDLLQGRPRDAAVTAGRLVINTAVGWGGLIDAAACMGLPPHHSDFGQTLAIAGVRSGPYLILPMLGPTTVRDAFGDAVGLLFRPTTYFLAGAESLFYTTAYGTGTGLVTLEEHARSLRRLESGSLDYYAALRNAYYQNRTAQIATARTSRPLGTDEAYCHCPGGCRRIGDDGALGDSVEPEQPR
ncbi:MAG TPA: VacJ family lipoprotein [Candidatus Limnocylindrales bacterium]|nr:VacJ family lipoprotein [Candidatus Limnocylindrales bacterium]